ncbi:uncharacterized protein Triagg1_4401 [Trichoderma aggressivum f. europaeum]|uniref:NTF2 domain-containing protein n=1 Tax=Trichoderma aggressivum f. europaeum TaxID=173218 RepID=A0AAE1IEE5_9HYPO|nr:hypothetical protein Triagg1_4401 [Trichoderma aggressivum f. europaeum]
MARGLSESIVVTSFALEQDLKMDTKSSIGSTSRKSADAAEAKDIMPLPDADTEVKASSEAAEIFVNNYYQAINSKAKLETYYINSSTRYSIPADISINGSVVPTPAEYSKLLESQGENVLYEIESLDSHIINPSFQYGAPDTVYESEKNEKSGRRMSIVVTTMGKVRFGKGREAPQKMFNETFVLVPNWDAMARNPARGLKRWLIMSQNFRAL